MPRLTQLLANLCDSRGQTLMLSVHHSIDARVAAIGRNSRVSLCAWQLLPLGCLLACGGGSDGGPSGTPGATAVATVTVSPSTISLAAGASQQLSAALADANGTALSGRTVTWGTSASSVATVSSSGLVTGVSDGSVTITATSERRTGSATATVQTPVASITVSPSAASLLTDGLQQFTATARDANGTPLPGRTVTWSTSDTSVATVNGGWAYGETVGTATITAASGGKNGTAAVTVTTVSCSTPSQPGCGLGLDQFALIPGGTFQMGWPVGNGVYLDAAPVHSVTLSRAFYLQKTPVTQAQWRAVMGSNPSKFPSCGDTCPVDYVSWNDAQAFIQALNAITPGVTYRLPTEAEWEYAAYAGATVGAYADPGVLEPIAWSAYNAHNRTHGVAVKAANAWGLYDMIGNVMQHVNDWYDFGYYAVSPSIDPPGPATGTARVARGSPWMEPLPVFCGPPPYGIGTCPGIYVASRTMLSPDTRSISGPYRNGSIYGFRLARNQ